MKLLVMSSLIDRLLKRKPVADEKIRYIEQRFDYDCGQTCLDMLGYDGHKMFPGRALTREELRSIEGVKEDYEIVLSETTHFEEPYIFDVPGVRDPSQYHFILVHGNRVYCPSLGVFKIKKYLRNIWSPRSAFQVPFAEDMKHTEQVSLNK